MPDLIYTYRQKLLHLTRFPYIVLVLLLLLGATIARNTIWLDEERFNDDAVRKSPGKARVFYNAGVYYHDIGDLDRAEACYLRATQLNTEYRDVYGSACYNLGVLYAKQLKIDLAMEAFTCAIATDPRDAAAYYKRGILFHVLGWSERGRADIERAMQLNPQADRLF